MAMSDKKIRKKIRGLINYRDYSSIISKDDVERWLDKTFPDVTIKCNGNNLFHYIAEYFKDYSNCNSYCDVIKMLMKRGLNIEEKNSNGKDFLQIICDDCSTSLSGLSKLESFLISNRFNSKLINNRDDEGNSIMHIILYNFKNQKILTDDKKKLISPRKFNDIEKMFDTIKNVFVLLVDMGYNQINASNAEESNIFEMVRTVQLKYQKKFNLSSTESWEKELMYHYYKERPVDFANKYFTEARDENLGQVKYYLGMSPIFFKEDDILFKCQKNGASIPQQIRAIEKYLELGFDPNYKINDYNFVEYAIKNKKSISYVLKLTKLAIQYGLDTNNCNIIKTMVKANYNSDDISLIKILIEQNGCKKNIDSLSVRIDTFHNVLILICRKVDMDYNYKELIDKEFVKFFFEIVDCYSFNNDLVNDYDFIEQTIMQIKEERNNSVVLNNNPITQLEVINALRTIITKRTNDKFNKFLVKK